MLSDGRKFANNGRVGGEIYTGSEEELIPVMYECSDLCSCPPTCKNRIGKGEQIKGLEVFRTPGMGWGVRTTQPIKKGTFIAKYAGETINNSEADKHEDTCKSPGFLRVIRTAIHRIIFNPDGSSEMS